MRSPLWRVVGLQHATFATVLRWIWLSSALDEIPGDCVDPVMASTHDPLEAETNYQHERETTTILFILSIMSLETIALCAAP